MSQKGRLIVFEGADGVGKTDISRQIASAITSSGIPTHLLSFPGRMPGTIGNLVYRIHHDHHAVGVTGVSPMSLQTLHVAAHLDAIETTIIPFLEQGNWVVLDRYWWSTWVYGAVAGISCEILDALITVERLAWGQWKPAFVFLVRRKSPLRNEDSGRWHQLVSTYDQLVEVEKEKYPIVQLQNDGTVEESSKEALAHLLSLDP